MAFELSKHASDRSQQRAIPPDVVEVLWEYGSEMRRRGGDVLFFDKPARQRLCRDLGSQALRRCAKALACYAVVDDHGRIITVAHRRFRFKRP